MLLTLTLALTLAQQPKAIAPYPRLLGEYATLEIGSVTLRGFIDIPDRLDPWPVVILHAGSGPTDKNGNGPLVQTDNLKMLGQALAAEGIAVLRIDKRGVGSSLFALEREEEASLDLYAKDVVAWAALLRKDSRFTKVGYIGHSEGAFIGLLAAKDAKFDAFVSLCGPGRTYQDLLREQLKKNLPAEQFKTAEASSGGTGRGRARDSKGRASVPAERAAVFDLPFKRPREALVAGVECRFGIDRPSGELGGREALARRTRRRSSRP